MAVPANWHEKQFSEGVHSLSIPTISYAKLSSSDETEIDKIADAMRETGAFYLDLREQADGVALLRGVTACRSIAQEIFSTLSPAQKQAYLSRTEPGAFDRGYVGWNISDDGEPIGHETVNIPVFDVMNGLGPDVLPSWLQPHEPLFRDTLKLAFDVSQDLLHSFELALGVSPDSLCKLHHWGSKQSHSVLRFLRYIMPVDSDTSGTSRTPDLKFPPHKDFSTISMLFTWMGGLQMLQPYKASQATSENISGVDEEHWLWVHPKPGCAIVNGGWLLEHFTQGAFRAAWHRVAPGATENSGEKYSVLFGVRPYDDTLLTPLQSEAVHAQHGAMQQTFDHGLSGQNSWAREPLLHLAKPASCHEWTVQAMGTFIASLQKAIPDASHMEM